MRGTITYELTRPDAETLRLSARDGFATIIRNADLHLPGRTPAQVAHALYSRVSREMLLSRPAVVTADWPHEVGPDTALWQRFRDVVAQMPRGG